MQYYRLYSRDTFLAFLSVFYAAFSRYLIMQEYTMGSTILTWEGANLLSPPPNWGLHAPDVLDPKVRTLHYHCREYYKRDLIHRISHFRVMSSLVILFPYSLVALSSCPLPFLPTSYLLRSSSSLSLLIYCPFLSSSLFLSSYPLPLLSTSLFLSYPLFVSYPLLVFLS